MTNPLERALTNPGLWSSLVIETDSDISEGKSIELSEPEKEQFIADCIELFGTYPEEDLLK